MSDNFSEVPSDRESSDNFSPCTLNKTAVVTSSRLTAFMPAHVSVTVMQVLVLCYLKLIILAL